MPLDSTSFALSLTGACALADDGAAYCWGSNWRGQLGDGSAVDSEPSVAVSGGHRFVAITMSLWTTCGLETDGVAWCWGDNQYGELGAGFHGEGELVSTPQRVATEQRFATISAPRTEPSRRPSSEPRRGPDWACPSTTSPAALRKARSTVGA